MKILIINAFDRGGAANACLRLHEGLLSEDIDSFVLLKNKQKNTPNTEVAKQKKNQKSKFQKAILKLKRILKELKILKDKPSKIETFIDSRSSKLEMFSFPFSNYDITESNLYKEADIVNLHWVADFLDYKSFFEKNTKPIVWTLHDMNPFTGGEHYEELFLGIDAEGKPINRIKTVLEKKVSGINLNLKKNIINNLENLTIVSPSKWLTKEAIKSEVFSGKKVFNIPNSLNHEIYIPRDKEYSRDIFKIPKDKKVILFVADSISNNRKGFIFLKKAFEQFAMDNIILCAIGNKNSELESINNILELGPIYDERLMSIAYSAADVFVIPSLMDNLPNTVLESIMCGTPVIGFPVGGIPDMIQDWENGLLTKDISVTSLLETLVSFLNSTEKFDRNAIRENAVKKYNQKLQSTRYIELFEKILKESR